MRSVRSKDAHKQLARMSLMRISRSRFKQSKNPIYVKWCFVNFWVIFGDVWEDNFLKGLVKSCEIRNIEDLHVNSFIAKSRFPVAFSKTPSLLSRSLLQVSISPPSCPSSNHNSCNLTLVFFNLSSWMLFHRVSCLRICEL